MPSQRRGGLRGAFLAITVSQAQARVEVKSYVDAEGFIDIQKTNLRSACRYIPARCRHAYHLVQWYDGLANNHFLRRTRGKELEHEVYGSS